MKGREPQWLRPAVLALKEARLCIRGQPGQHKNLSFVKKKKFFLSKKRKRKAVKDNIKRMKRHTEWDQERTETSSRPSWPTW